MQDSAVPLVDTRPCVGEANGLADEEERGGAAAAADNASFPPPARVGVLVTLPTFPNAVKWSDENLLAVASGHLAYVLNPSLEGARCYVPVTTSPRFDIGKVQRQDILAPSIIGLSLAKDLRPFVRSVAWSPHGFASNGGCLLAICTTDHRVKFYRSPYAEFQSEWVEVLDLSEIVYAQLVHSNFEETESRASALALEDEALAPPAPAEKKKRRVSKLKNQRMEGFDEGVALDANCVPMKVSPSGNRGALSIDEEMLRGPSQNGHEGTVPKLVTDNVQRTDREEPNVVDSATEEKYVTAAQYAARSDALAHIAIAWSPEFAAQCCRDGAVGRPRYFSVFAVGGKSGRVMFFRISKPLSYSVGKPQSLEGTEYLGYVAAHESWITILEWVSTCEVVGSQSTLLLASGSSDGSVKLWISSCQVVGDFCSSTRVSPFKLLGQVMDVDLVPVTSLAVVIPPQSVSKVRMAVGKGSGSLSVIDCDTSSGEQELKAFEVCAHDQLVTGSAWRSDARVLYSCGQDNSLRLWEFSKHRLWSTAPPTGTSLLETDSSQISEELPASVLESCLGVAQSPGSLAIVVVRGVSAEMVDPMYQSRSQRAVVQLYWLGGLLTQQDVSGPDDPAADLVCWKSKVVVALHYIEQKGAPVVLWDVIAASLLLSQRATSVSFIEAILSSWLSSQDSGTQCGSICEWSREFLREYVRNASCRRLQMLNVFYRRLLLTGVKADVISGRSGSQEALNAGGEGGDVVQDKSMGEKSSSSLMLLRNHVTEIERELRLRLVYLSLLGATSKTHVREGEEDTSFEDRSDLRRVQKTHVMAAWAAASDCKDFPELMQVAASLQESGDVKSDCEVCHICKAPVPLESFEIAYCKRSESEGQGRSHKLQRCAVCLNICPPTPLWLCKCCSRWVADLPPLLFFSISSRMQVMQIPVPVLIRDSVSPCCPFCGILLQRLLPAFLLSPSPV